MKIALSKDSIVAWHFRSFHRKHRRIQQWVDRPGGPTVVRFTRARQAEAWLASLSA